MCAKIIKPVDVLPTLTDNMSVHQLAKSLILEIGQLSLCRAFLLLKKEESIEGMTTKQLLSSNSYIQFPKFLGAHIGSNEALLLSVFCDVDSWCNFNVENYDGWFYILQNDILWETGLSEKQQRAALSHLYELNIIYIEKRDVPAKNYYFINTNELENVLNDAYISYKAHKTQMLQNVTSRTDKMSHQDTTKNSVSSINTKNKNIRINNKSTGAGALSKNHSQVYKKRESLNDDLESGEIIDEHIRERKKKSEYDKCLAEIDKRYSEPNLYMILVNHLEWSYKSKDPKRIRTLAIYKRRLDELDKLDGDKIAIVQQSINRQWHCFYELQESKSKLSNKREELSDVIKVTTQEEVQNNIAMLRESGKELF